MPTSKMSMRHGLQKSFFPMAASIITALLFVAIIINGIGRVQESGRYASRPLKQSYIDYHFTEEGEYLRRTKRVSPYTCVKSLALMEYLKKMFPGGKSLFYISDGTPHHEYIKHKVAEPFIALPVNEAIYYVFGDAYYPKGLVEERLATLDASLTVLGFAKQGLSSTRIDETSPNGQYAYSAGQEIFILRRNSGKSDGLEISCFRRTDRNNLFLSILRAIIGNSDYNSENTIRIREYSDRVTVLAVGTREAKVQVEDYWVDTGAGWVRAVEGVRGAVPCDSIRKYGAGRGLKCLDKKGKEQTLTLEESEIESQ